MYEWYSISWTDVVKKLNSDINKGLKLEQVEKLQRLRSEEEVLKFNNIKTSTLVFKQIRELWTVISIINIIGLIFFNHWILILILMIMNILNVFLVVNKQLVKEKELDELKKFDLSYIKVLREGKYLRVLPKELVVGDIVYLEKGDVVPADLRVIKSENLKVNEAQVTGEAYISEKYEAKIIERDLPFSEMKNILFKASKITTGSGEGIVIYTGANSQIGKIIKILIEEKNKYIDFLIKDSNYILNKMSIISVLLGLLGASLFYLKTNNIMDGLEALSLIFTSFMPISLISILSLSGKTILKTFNKRDIIIKDLTVVKAFAETNLLFVDKIGAITEKTVEVIRIFTDDRFYDFGEEALERTINIERIVDIGMLCNDASKNSKIALSSFAMIEKSLINFGNIMFQGKEDIDLQQKRVLTVPFDSELRIMTTINKVENNYRANVKGPVDTLIRKCKYIMKDGIEKEINEWDVEAIRKAETAMEVLGCAALGFAYRNFNYEPSLDENVESNLVFVGVIGFINHIADDSYGAVEYLIKERLKHVIVVEESKLAAMALGKKLGILAENKLVVSGVDLENLKEDDFKRSIDRTNILSNVTDELKNRAVMALKELGNKVVVTGAKLTELPALMSAQVGIGIGENCSSLVKKLGDIWLLDYSLSNIILVKKYCYKILASINKAVCYYLACIIAQGIFASAMIFFGNINLSYFSLVVLVNLFISFIGSVIVSMGYEYEKIEEMSYLYQSNIIRKNKYDRDVLKGIIVAAAAIGCFSLNVRFSFIWPEAAALLILSIGELILIYWYRKFKWIDNGINWIRRKKNK